MTKIFAEFEFSARTEMILSTIKQEIFDAEKNHLLNMNEDEYISYLVKKNQIDPIEINDELMWVSEREDMIPAELYPFNFHVVPGKRYLRQIITFHIPFNGDRDLLTYQPKQRMLWTMDVGIRENEILFDIINFSENGEQLRAQANVHIKDIKQQAVYLNNDITVFNEKLEQFISKTLKDRKQQYLKSSNLLTSLGVPVKKPLDVLETFAVATVKKKVIVQKPISSEKPLSPEPTIDDKTYYDILRTCLELGVKMEQHPSLYTEKDEEALRDVFLLGLSPHFDSVTGETFNKSGKTDIIIKHGGKNIFVAECKFWRGPAAHSDTIDQALGYLTWRDSKAAILYFVDNKNFNPVLKQIPDETAKHRCFVKQNSQTSESWFNYNFRLLEDESRSVKLAILCFHFPKTEKTSL